MTDGLVQQFSNLGGLNSRGLGVRGELSGKRGTEGGNPRQILAQSVMQLPPEPFLFTVSGLKDFDFQIFTQGNVAGDRVDLPAGAQTIGVPLKPLVRAILTAVAILEQNRAPATGELFDFGQGGGAVAGMDEIEEEEIVSNLLLAF